MHDPNLAFDLGVAALASGDAPAATAYLLEAHDLAPRDREIASALAAARRATHSEVHRAATWPVAAADLALGLVIVNVALCAALALRARRRLVITLTALWLIVGALWVGRYVAHHDYAVIAKPDVVTHVADDATSLPRFTTHLGDELLIAERRGEWLKVYGPGGGAYVARRDVASTEVDGQR